MEKLTTLINDVSNTMSQVRLEAKSLETNLHSLRMQNKNALAKNVPEDLDAVTSAIESNIKAIVYQTGELLKKIPPIEEPKVTRQGP